MDTAGKGSARYLALFNASDKTKSVTQSWDFYNLPGKTYRSRELWSKTDYGSADGVKLTLAPHSAALLELAP